MAIKTRFYTRIQNNKTSKNATIYCRLTNGRKTDIRISTGLSIIPSFWNPKTGATKDTTLGTDEEIEMVKYVQENINGISTTLIKNLANNENYSKQDALNDIETYYEKKKNENKNKPLAILPFLDTIIEDMKSGVLLHKSKHYSDNTIKVWNSFKKVLDKFINLHANKITWETIDQSVFDKFVKFLKDCDYTTKTANKYIICFNALLVFGYKRKQHKSKDITDDFYKIPETEGCKTKNIYLTNEEIQALYEMPLAEGTTECIVRDVFLCGCYTAQRISDYGSFTEENFTTTAKGTEVVKLVQEKTGNSVTVPILNKNLLEIVQKYNYSVPKISEGELNIEIKNICKELSQNVPSLAKIEQTILILKEKEQEKAGKITYERDKNGNVVKPRYMLVSSHTARRSAITNLYLTGKFDTYQLMSISGHKTEKAFQTYLCMSSDEIADRIAATLKEQEKKQKELF